MSWSTEAGYDNVIVEAHTVGQDDWTTLPDANGGTSDALPADHAYACDVDSPICDLKLTEPRQRRTNHESDPGYCLLA